MGKPFICRKQHRYATKLDALIELASIQRRDNPRRRKMEKRAYFCACGSWHLTSQEKRTAEAR
ncbi:hypothetical protein SEA_EASTWEST_71 [Arthrobacter phage EastWest]|uniref:Uncharacterized protein n=1 Tax=Arthrobacter phage EastWest TaxID=2894292 RepID=A0AAE8YKJ0_9CAUD|nr:hypothetical protein SEA_EASTWEST_71 [Arthrobacter phage EastWest]